MLRARICLAGGTLLLLFVSCRRSNETPRQLDANGGGSISNAGYNTSPISDDGQWMRSAKDYANTRFTGLDQITTENVKDLKLSWTFSTGVTRGHEAAPLVVNGTLYVVTPFPNILYALDLTKPNAPAKWTYKPDVQAA